YYQSRRQAELRKIDRRIHSSSRSYQSRRALERRQALGLTTAAQKRRNKMKIIKALFLAVISIIFVAGPIFAQAPIKIGASISLTGSYAKLGSYTQDGYLMCAKEINEKGGLLGRKLEFVVYDDRSDSPTAIKLYEKLITEDKVELVMGPYSSPITKAAATVSEKYKKIMMASLAA